MIVENMKNSNCHGDVLREDEMIFYMKIVK